MTTATTPHYNADSQSQAAEVQSLPPRYSDLGIEGSSSIDDADGFKATSQFYIHANGYTLGQALYGKTLENTYIYRVDTSELAYTSVRTKRKSNSCALVRGSDGPPLIATIYRRGPFRHARMRIYAPGAVKTVDDAINSDWEDEDGDLVKVESKSIFTHTQKFDTPYGTFEWRDGSKRERKDAAADATTLMIMERHDLGNEAVPVARFVRTPEFRTPGTKKDVIGERGAGGRLMLDLTSWRDQKVEIDDVEAFIVASCICMIKRETDRYIEQSQAVVMGV
ncbi:hypothetical protein PYCC9005_005896 [Savitreella phatthalungensis]